MPLKEIIPPLFGVTDTNVCSETNEYNELYDPTYITKESYSHACCIRNNSPYIFALLIQTMIFVFEK